MKDDAEFIIGIFLGAIVVGVVCWSAVYSGVTIGGKIIHHNCLPIITEAPEIGKATLDLDCDYELDIINP